MAVEGSGLTLSENVFIQSPRPRVGFGEPYVPSGASSLLTFADMVLSFDRKAVLKSISKTSKMTIDPDEPGAGSTDHTYATSTLSRTTRSQTAKAAHWSAVSQDVTPSGDYEQDLCIDLDADSDLDRNTPVLSVKREKKLSVSQQSFDGPLSPFRPVGMDSFCTHSHSNTHKYSIKDKRCSSVENISFEQLPPKPKRDYDSKEWPQGDLTKLKVDKFSRKTGSNEEVDNKSKIKSSKSSENIQKSGVSQSLHRFVNNTIEFPSWHRKADHTYATATWDGTAASHNIFDGHISQIFGTDLQDHPMEDLENQTVQSKHQPASDLFGFLALQQKDDHTYVKSSQQSSTASSIKPDVSPKSAVLSYEGYCKSPKTVSGFDNLAARPRFSSATFPRLKTREDHTYFHSGLSGSNTSTGGREWVSAQTVASNDLSHDMQIEETYRSLHSFAQSASAKKDHNYSTSA